MTALALWIAGSVVVGLVIGRAIRAGSADSASACSQNCNQGRNCTCRAPKEVA